LRRLTGQSALLTGASSGFGRSIALALAEQGSNVALVARREPKLQEVAEQIENDFDALAVICPADIGKEEQINSAITKALDEFGRIDILINNAGMNISARSIEETSPEQWRELIKINLTSAFIFVKRLLPQMKKNGFGTIINIASRAAIFPDIAGGVAYSTSKMGMDALTQICNEEGNPHNVRSCLLCPGTGNTPIVNQRSSPPSPEQRKKLLQPEEVAEVVVLVATMEQRVNIEKIVLKPTTL